MAIAKLILTWMVLGFPLSFSKGKRGKSPVWIGAQITVGSLEVVAEITEAKISELKQLTFELLSTNVPSIKAVRSYVGKAQNVAVLVHTWRPFLSNIWGAIADHNAGKHTGCPAGCIWRKQIAQDLHWISSFLEGVHGTLERRFRVGEYLGQGVAVTLVTDASPWGIGAWLKIGEKVVEYFSDAIHPMDAQVLQTEAGSCKSQQCFEALAMLVSLRLWKLVWLHSRTVITVKADNIAALTLVASMKARRGPMSVVAREMALDVACGLYSPSVAEHLPGVVNESADALSRRHQPGKTFVLPFLLEHAKERRPGNRSGDWWRSITA